MNSFANIYKLHNVTNSVDIITTAKRVLIYYVCKKALGFFIGAYVKTFRINAVILVPTEHNSQLIEH